MASDVVVVGGGAAGLAVAATLRQHGVPNVILETTGEIGGSWRARYESLRLHTVRWLSGLPGQRVPRRYGKWVARNDFASYLASYAHLQHLVIQLGVEVQRLDRSADGWRLQTSAGVRTAPVVVIATGYNRAPVIPDWPGLAEFERPLLHSSAYREPSEYAGKHVLVVGAGNSAAEIAVELLSVGATVELSVRTPPNVVRRDRFGIPSQLFGVASHRLPEWVMNPLNGMLRRITVPDLTGYGLPAPTGGYTQFLRTRTTPILDHGFVQQIVDRRITVRAAVDRLSRDQVHLTDGTTVSPDAVICATGFRPDLDDMVGHLGVLDQQGIPLSHGADSPDGAPGLYFVGVSVQLAGLIREIRLEARAVGQAIAAGRSTAA